MLSKVPGWYKIRYHTDSCHYLGMLRKTLMKKKSRSQQKNKYYQMTSMSTDIPTFMITRRTQVIVWKQVLLKHNKITNKDGCKITCELLHRAASAPAFWGRQNQACVRNLPHNPENYQLLLIFHPWKFFKEQMKQCYSLTIKFAHNFNFTKFDWCHLQ